MMDTIYVKCESVLKEDIDDHVITVKEVKVSFQQIVWYFYASIYLMLCDG